MHQQMARYCYSHLWCWRCTVSCSLFCVAYVAYQVAMSSACVVISRYTGVTVFQSARSCVCANVLLPDGKGSETWVLWGDVRGALLVRW